MVSEGGEKTKSIFHRVSRWDGIRVFGGIEHLTVLIMMISVSRVDDREDEVGQYDEKDYHKN